MNQRIKRSSKKNQLDQISLGNSAYPTRRSTDRGPGEVVIPNKVTGDIKEKVNTRLAGLAKASPLFKTVKPEAVVSPEEEKKAIAEGTVNKTKDKDNDTN